MDVSIIIPYNKDRGYLKETISSCDSQVFNGSFEVILEHGDHNVSTNINNALKRCKGKYIKLCAEDDRLTEDCIQDLFNEAEYGYDIVIADAYNFYEDGSTIPYSSVIPKTVKDLAIHNTIHGGTVLYRKELVKFDETLYTGEEFELHLRLAFQGAVFGYTNKVVHLHRIYDGQKSTGANTDKIERRRYINERIVKRYMIDIPINTAPKPDSD